MTLAHSAGFKSLRAYLRKTAPCCWVEKEEEEKEEEVVNM
jgi:hypothetical protein